MSVARARRLRRCQAALIYGYSLWGGLKELVATFLVVVAAPFAPTAAEELRSVRRCSPFSFVCAALFAALNVSAAFGAAACTAAFVFVARLRARRLTLSLLGGVGITALLSLPTIVIVRAFLHLTTSNLLTPEQRLGNLPRPLNLLQIFGIWPSGDFRVWPFDHLITELLIAVAALAAAATVALCATPAPVSPAASCSHRLLVALLLGRVSCPWLAGKAYATALAGARIDGGWRWRRFAFERDNQDPSVVLGALIIGGVLWSNVLAYHDVWLAPRASCRNSSRSGRPLLRSGPGSE